MRTLPTLSTLHALVALALAGAPSATAGPPLATSALTAASTFKIS